jgi:hypothetical protein
LSPAKDDRRIEGVALFFGLAGCACLETDIQLMNNAEAGDNESLARKHMRTR